MGDVIAFVIIVVVSGLILFGLPIVMLDAGAQIGHDQGACDMACGARSQYDVKDAGKTLVCFCGEKKVRMFERVAAE